MKNRYGVEYSFEKVSDNIYTIVGALEYWRYGGREGDATLFKAVESIVGD